MEMNHHVILLCTSILSLSEVVKAIPFQSLKTQTLFVDVLSVKEYPREVLLQVKRKKNGNYPFTSVFLYLSVSIGNLIIFFFFFCSFAGVQSNFKRRYLRIRICCAPIPCLDLKAEEMGGQD